MKFKDNVVINRSKFALCSGIKYCLSETNDRSIDSRNATRLDGEDNHHAVGALWKPIQNKNIRLHVLSSIMVSNCF